VVDEHKVIPLLIEYKTDPYQGLTGKSGEILSSVVSFSFFGVDNDGQEVKVDHSGEGFVIKMRASKELEVLWAFGKSNRDMMSCQFWDEDALEWSGKGCDSPLNWQK